MVFKRVFYFPQKTKAVIEIHPFAGLYRAAANFACQIYIANTAGHITSPTSKAAFWKAQRILEEIYSPHLYASETCWSNLSPPLLFLCFMCEVGQHFNDPFSKLLHLQR